MKQIFATLLLAGVAIGAAGCGGSSQRQTITVVTQGSASTAATTAAAATTSSAAHKSRKAQPAKAHTNKPAASTSATHASSANYKYPVIPTKPTRDTVSSCLRSAGLARIGVVRANEWAGTDRLRLKPVFVDGPYKSSKVAARAAASLNGVEAVESAGLYVVSALLTSDLGADVKLVAGCLSHAPEVKSNGGAMTF